MPEGKSQGFVLKSGDLAKLDHFKVRGTNASHELDNLVKEKVSSVPKSDLLPEGEGEAKEILGKDFLGVEAIKQMGTAFAQSGLTVEFDLSEVPPVPYTKEDLEIAKKNGEMLVLRAEKMIKDGVETPLSIINFRELFRKDPLNKQENIFYSFSPDSNDWYKNENFATDEGDIALGWALVKKEVLNSSTSSNYSQQDKLLKQYEADLKKDGAVATKVRRRTAKEVVWDTLLYYVNTGEKLLENTWDWTSTPSQGKFVSVGDFVADGMDIGSGRD